MLVLALESSTSAAKALVYDTKKGIVAEDSRSYPTSIGSNGKLDTETVFQTTLEVGRTIAANMDIAAVAVSGVWHSVAICDSSMKPVTPTYMWTFTEAGEVCRQIRSDKQLAKQIYTETGCMPNITYQPYTIRHLIENGLNLKDKLFCSQAGYNFYHMTGEWLETASIVSGMGLLCVHTRSYSDAAFEIMRVKKQQWAPLCDYRDTHPLHADCAAFLGIPAGIPVVPPHADGALNQIGNGAIRPGRMTFSVGTSAAIRLSTNTPILSDPPATWCYAGVKDWISGAATAGSCNCINWFKESALQNKWSFKELESTFCVPNHKTPVFLPFLFGERCPGWRDERRGSFLELDESTTIPDIFQGICEGILFNIYHCYHILTKLSGIPEKIIMSGGILNSPLWSQMAADIFGREIVLSQTPQTSLLGGAVLAMHAAGALKNLEDYMDPSDTLCSPQSDAHEAYTEKFERYLSFYHQQKTSELDERG